MYISGECCYSSACCQLYLAFIPYFPFPGYVAWDCVSASTSLAMTLFHAPSVMLKCKKDVSGNNNEIKSQLLGLSYLSLLHMQLELPKHPTANGGQPAGLPLGLFNVIHWHHSAAICLHHSLHPPTPSPLSHNYYWYPAGRDLFTQLGEIQWNLHKLVARSTF